MTPAKIYKVNLAKFHARFSNGAKVAIRQEIAKIFDMNLAKFHKHCMIGSQEIAKI